MKFNKIHPDLITFTLTATPCDVDAYTDLGDCMSRREITKLLNRAEKNVWRWCTVRLYACFGGLTTHAYLGACSYKSAEDFRKNSGYYEQMQEEAADELQELAASIARALIG